VKNSKTCLLYKR